MKGEHLLIVSDNDRVSSNLYTTLVGEHNIIGVVRSSEAALRLNRLHELTAVIVAEDDINSQNGVEIARVLRKKFPGIRIVSINPAKSSDWSTDHLVAPASSEDIKRVIREL
jgi:two-component SAPR family response regulator